MNKWKDKWFYYKLFTAVLILAGLLALYLYHMIAQTWFRGVDYPFNYLIFQGQFFSYFTFQSNFIIGVWFLIATLYHNRKHKLIDNQNIMLAATCYISVTSFVYLAVLIPGMFLMSTKMILEDMITGPFFHVLTPTLMIFYSLMHVQTMKLSAKQYYTKNFFFYLIYPWLYTLYLVGRLVVYSNVASLKDVPLIIVYPYFPVLDLGETIAHAFDNAVRSVLAIVVFFIVVHVLFVLFNLIYFFSFKKLANKH